MFQLRKEVGDLSETAVASFRFEMGPGSGPEEEEGIPSLGSSAHPDKCTEPEAKSRFLLFGGSSLRAFWTPFLSARTCL